MWKRILTGVCTLALATLVVARPAESEVGPLNFRILPTPTPRAVGGKFTVRWEDVREDGLDPGLYSITWYYATRPDGSDRRRMAASGETFFRDDFSAGFRNSWRPDGPFPFDWSITRPANRRDARAKDCLNGTAQAGPCLSVTPVMGNVVVSVLVQPSGLRNEFGLGVRVQPNGRGYELRNDGNVMRLMRGNDVLREESLRDVRPNRWYWYEIGLRSLRKEVNVRVRVYDETHQRVLARMTLEERPEWSLLRGGLIALWGPASFGEIYVDPWASRWVDDARNFFEWNTADVPDGKYYVVAELAAERGPGRVFVSDYQVEVDHSGQEQN